VTVELKKITGDAEISLEHRELLLSVVTYYRARNPRTSYETMMEEALKAFLAYEAAQIPVEPSKLTKKPEVQVDARALAEATENFKNFVQRLGKQGVGLVFEYFRTIVAKPSYYSEVPRHIQKAIVEIYGSIDGISPPVSIATTMRSLEDPAYRESISLTYNGVWDVFRYAGHGEGNIMWAAMNIAPLDPEVPNSWPGFEIHYRAHAEPKGSHRQIRGSILSLIGGQHMLFVGQDHDSRYPVDIVAEQRRSNGPSGGSIDFLTGIMKRKHETARVMVAKIACMRAARGVNLQARRDLIGAYTANEFRKAFAGVYKNGDCDDIFLNIKNHVRGDGYSALLY
jgi:hypothetical protein